MLNEAKIIGRLGADPEVQQIQGGYQVARVNVATSKKYKDRSGQEVEDTQWHKIEVWGKSSEYVKNWLSKGDLVYVSGEMVTDKYQDRNTGETKYSHKIKAYQIQGLDVAKAKQRQGQNSGGYGQPQGQPQYQNSGSNYNLNQGHAGNQFLDQPAAPSGPGPQPGNGGGIDNLPRGNF